MTVYVDDMRAPFGRMVVCHMMADTLEELHAMANRLGLKRRWFQGPPKHDLFPHYDISLTKRALAVRYGAVEVTQREMVRRFSPRFMTAGPIVTGPNVVLESFTVILE